MKALRVITSLLAAGWITAIDIQPVLAQIEAQPTRPVQVEPKPERPHRRDHRRPHRVRPDRPERRDHDRTRPERPERERVQRVERPERSAKR